MIALWNRRWFGVLLLSAFVLGCGQKPQPMPTTYPVKGKVVVKKTGQPLAGGSISFQPASDTQMAYNGIIAEDGTFSISTLRLSDQQRADGVPEGEYRVTIVPKSTGQDPSMLPIDLPKVKIEAKENDLKLEVDRK